MNFRNGYLGACIVVLGVVATIVCGYALSIEVTDEEITKYQYVADLNGLFDSEQAPAFIDYNPSTNYTGYYTDNSIIGNTKYFDGVEYTNGAVNQYRLNLMPTNRTTGTLTLSGTDWTTNANLILNLVTEFGDGTIGSGTKGLRLGGGTSATLSSIIEDMNLPDGINYIVFKSTEGQDELEEPYLSTQYLSLDWIMFTNKNFWSGATGIVLTNEYREMFPNDPYNRPAQYLNSVMLSCSVDLTNSLVTLYHDNDLQESANTYNLDDIIVSFGGTNTAAGALNLGTDLQYEYMTRPDATYMDIRDGVWMEE